MITRLIRASIFAVVLLITGCMPRDAGDGVPVSEPMTSEVTAEPTIEPTPTEEIYEDINHCGVSYPVIAWTDVNENGIYEQGEPMLPGITFHLVLDFDDGEFDTFQVTDSKGSAYLDVEWVEDYCTPPPRVLYPNIPDGYRVTTQERMENMETDWETTLWFGFATLPGVPTVTAPNPIACTAYNIGLAPDNEGSGEIADLYTAPDGTLWAGSYGAGLGRYDAATDSWTFYTTEDGLDSTSVGPITSAPDGSLWIGSGKGVAHFNGTIWESYSTADGLLTDYVYGITIGQDGVVWFATLEGVSGFDPLTENWVSYQIVSWISSDGEPNNNLFQDAVTAPNGDIWFTTGLNGLARMIPPGEFGQEPQWEFYVTDESESPVEQPDDNITVYVTSSWAFSGPVNSVIFPDGAVLVGDSVLALLNPDTHEASEIDSSEFEHFEYRRISLAPDGTLWGTSFKVGVSHVVLSEDRTRVVEMTRYNQYDGLISDEIVDIEFTPDGAIWFASPEGVARCVMAGE
jgi:streptogramin lyase